jgi:hypothetical protein
LGSLNKFFSSVRQRFTGLLEQTYQPPYFSNGALDIVFTGTAVSGLQFILEVTDTTGLGTIMMTDPQPADGSVSVPIAVEIANSREYQLNVSWLLNGQFVPGPNENIAGSALNPSEKASWVIGLPTIYVGLYFRVGIVNSDGSAYAGGGYVAAIVTSAGTGGSVTANAINYAEIGSDGVAQFSFPQAFEVKGGSYNVSLSANQANAGATILNTEKLTLSPADVDTSPGPLYQYTYVSG